MQKILVIVGSARPHRRTKDVADWIVRTGDGHDSLTLELIDLKTINLPFLDEPEPPLFGNYQKEHTKQWAAKVASADGFILTTPEYNHGYSPVLKNALDFLFAEWQHKPVAFAGQGSDGGIRAIEQLKQVVIQLDMAPLNAEVKFNAWTDWDKTGAFHPTEHHHKALKKMFADLTWWGEALKAARRKR